MAGGLSTYIDALRVAGQQEMPPSYTLVSCGDSGSVLPKTVAFCPEWLTRRRAEQAAAQLCADRRMRGTAEPVDLGLSVLWASHNLGAPCPEQPGYYAGWGDATCSLVSTYYEDYPSQPDISGTKYDAARMLWKEKWRMPNLSEMAELMQKGVWQWTQINGVTGFRVSGPTGNSIFLPAGGDRMGTGYEDAYVAGRYWTSERDKADEACACMLEFTQGSGNIYPVSRYMGLLVRPVLPRDE